MNRMESLWAVLLLYWLALALPSLISGFSSFDRARCHHSKRSSSESSSRLFYQNQQQQQHATPPSPASGRPSVLSLSLPVLGPLVTAPPLLVGSHRILSDVTPMQRQSLQAAVRQHEAYQKKEKDDGGGNDSATTTGVSAAPLIVLMDEHTAIPTGTQQPMGAGAGRYATLCAIAGATTTTKTTTSQEQASQGLDTSDNSAFMESLDELRNINNQEDTSIRLIAVGRAVLTGFFYQTVELEEDDQGYLVDVPEHPLYGSKKKNMYSQYTDSTDDEEEEAEECSIEDDARHECHVTSQVIMAQFRVVRDTACRGGDGNSGHKPRASVFTSPVHGLAELSRACTVLHGLHQERQRLVQTIRAARVRLNQAQESMQDHDGLGQLFEEKENDEGVIQNMLNEYPAQPFQQYDSSRRPKVMLETLSNYGLGETASSCSTLLQLAQHSLNEVSPYYSPSVLSSEELYYEIFSFSAVRAVADDFLEARHAAWACTCTHTAARLKAVQEWMQAHVLALQLYTSILADELRQCGDQCTDLWGDGE